MALNDPLDGPTPAALPIDLDALPVDSLIFDYDRESDTLLVHFYGRSRSAVSIEAGDHAYVRLDRAADRIVGLHLEHFRSAVVPNHHELLAHAAVYGIAPAPAESITTTTRAAATTRRRAALSALGGLFAPETVGSRAR